MVLVVDRTLLKAVVRAVAAVVSAIEEMTTLLKIEEEEEISPSHDYVEDSILPWQNVNDMIRNYNESIILENKLLYQTTFNGISANIQIGFSVARGFLPAVIIISNSNSSRISFTREEWMDLINVLPSSTTATICAVKPVMTIFENFTVRLGSCSSVGDIHSRGQTVYLHNEFLQELAGLKELINYRLELLELLDFKNFHSNIISNVGKMMLDGSFSNISVFDVVKQILIGFKYSHQAYCMLEYLNSYPDNILVDFNRMNYM